MPISSTGPRDKHLFVYGSLMSSVSTPMGARERIRLAGESRSLGPAKTQGRLYNLGQYPGLAPPTSPDDIVQGELLELFNPAATFLWLDQYEGVPHGNRSGGDYLRAIWNVELQKSKFANSQAGAPGLLPDRPIPEQSGSEPSPAYRQIKATPHQPATILNRSLRAWIYVYQGPLDPLRLVPSGNWQRR